MTGVYRIEICGGIATGKTTLARQLAQIYGLALFEEKFAEVPFWRECYESRGRKFLFQKNVSFLPYHAHRIAEATALKRASVCDFSFFQDLAYADLSSTADETEILETVFDRFAAPFPWPAAIVDLTCSTSIQLERIRLRGREPEKDIDATLLRELRNAIDKRRHQFEQQKQLTFITVNSEVLDFRNNTSVVEKIWRQIECAINVPSISA